MLLKTLFVFMAFLPLYSLAQQATDNEPLPDDLQSLMNTPVAVASIKEMTVSESPAILTIITKEDMSRYGLRYLSDIRFIIPGIDFGCDVLGVVGIGIRNNWAHEGKVLIMLDGIELNEGLYSNTLFGNHYSLDNIEKIEIIRGPGSVMYGGNAALSVLNMISKSPNGSQAININSTLSFTSKALAERGGSISVTHGTQRSGFTVFSRFSRDIRSDRSYSDLSGNTYDLTDNSEIDNAVFHFSGKHKGWNLSFLYDDYKLESKDGYVDITERSLPVQFESLTARLKKTFRPNNKIEITPIINYKYQTPWSVLYENKSEKMDEIICLGRFSAASHLTWSVTDYHSLAAGIEHWFETASSPEGTYPYFENYNNRFIQRNFSAFLQTTSKFRHWSFSPGARISYSTRSFSSFVPRFAVTRNWRWGYSKAIASRSFRNPTVMNLLANPDIRPEFATVLELETGISLKPFSVLSINLYRMAIHDPITYYYNEETQEDKFINDGRAGTEGVEICFNHHFPASKLILTASASQPVRSNNQLLYKVDDHDKYLLGFSPFQFSVNYSCLLINRMTVWSLLAFHGKKYGITAVDDNGSPVFSEFPESYLMNVGINIPLDSYSRWSLSISVNNLLHQPINYIQPYRSFHGALPGKGREFGFRLNYHLN